MKRIFIWGLAVLAELGSPAADAVTNEPPASATNGVALEVLVTETLRESPELQFYRAEIAAAKAGRKAAGLMPNPELSGSLGHKTSPEPRTQLRAARVPCS